MDGLFDRGGNLQLALLDDAGMGAVLTDVVRVMRHEHPGLMGALLVQLDLALLSEPVIACCANTAGLMPGVSTK